MTSVGPPNPPGQDLMISHSTDDVVAYVMRQFGDESGVQIIDDDIYRWINQAQMEINSKNKILRSISTSTGSAGHDTYQKPADCMNITAVKYDVNLIPYIGFDDYVNKFQGPSDYTSIPVATSQCPIAWTQYGNAIIFSSPLPETGKVITIFYIPEPKQVYQGQQLALPDRYFDRICEYVMSKAYELDEDWNAHQAQRSMLESNLTEMSNEESNAQGAYPVVVDYSYDRYTGDFVWYP